MTYTWNSQFAGFPSGSNFGLTMGEALRRLLGAFHERFAVEHEWDETATPVITHKAGECSVVLVYNKAENDGDAPTSNGVAGALVFIEDAPTLYGDSSSSLYRLSTAYHSLLDNLDADDHPFIKVAGEAIADSDFSLTAPRVKGLPTVFNPAANDKSLMSIGAHIGTDAVTGSKHDDDVIPDDLYNPIGSAGIGILMGNEKFSFSNETMTITFTGAGSYRIWAALAGTYDVMSIPMPVAGSKAASNTTIYMTATDQDHDDYRGDMYWVPDSGGGAGSWDCFYTVYNGD